jgi:hypothetical protein
MITSSVPVELHPILGSTYFAFASAMACRVFRAVLLGIIKEPQMNTTQLVSFFRGVNDDTLDHDDDVDTARHAKSGRSSKLEIAIAIETDTTSGPYDGYTFGERKQTGDGVQRDASHQV